MYESLTGKLLIAMPTIGDPRFDRSVILVCAHNSDYAMGIVLNKPIETLTLPDLFEQLDVPIEVPLPEQAVLDGGPVGNDRGFVIHSSDVQCEGATMAISQSACLTATRDILLAMGSDARPAQAVMALGYSGWGPGQLERELKDNAWLLGEPDPDLLFGGDYADKWNRALDRIGVSSGRLHAMPGRA